ncbi:hypothetical protein EAH75_00090 [Rhodanobacter glycinis]|uniref:Uncharacterized protein n=1 Tax=Rhodanobacter glycinis TaxID=582702 RepID=A0A502BVF4_9GAMM|nr:hypothetical protein [Rhodanobacter glycinis]TPG04533.1 hypothetical protein EAH88_17900 [Rhodanobacter glycinis]TPG51350.1 hypothetical protein EAH75_00090 [Rhodanobacter glycinis]
MILTVFLVAPNDVRIEHIEEAPELLERDGRWFSLRGGPRQPRPTDRVWDPVAVYAPDELTEEEFQELFELNKKHVPELNLRY